MARASKTGNAAVSGITSTSQNSGTTSKKDQVVYSDDLFIDTYIKSRLNGASPLQAGEAAHTATHDDNTHYMVPRENTQITAGLQSGEYIQRDGRTYLSEDASKRYADRVKATQAQNNWANSQQNGIGVGKAIAGGAVSGLWQNITGAMNLGAAAAGKKITSPDTESWTGVSPQLKSTAIRKGFSEKLKDIWGDYEFGDGSLGKNLKSTAFSAYDAAWKQLLEGNGLIQNPTMDAIAKGSNVLFKVIRDYVLPKVTGSKDAKTNAQWLTDQAYGLSDKATKAVASGGGILQYADPETFQGALQNSSAAAGVAGQVSNVVANMLPSILTSFITQNPDAGLGLMAGTAAGSAAKEAYSKGANAQQAAYTGVEKGYVEYMTERMFDAIGAFGGGLVSDKLKNLMSDMALTKAGRAMMKLADLYGENIEEAVSDWAGPGIDRAVWGNEDEENLSILEAISGQAPWTEQGVITLLSTLVMGGMGSVIRNNIITVPKAQAQEILDIAKSSGNQRLIALAEEYNEVLNRRGKLGAEKIQTVQEASKRVMGEDAYVNALMESRKQREQEQKTAASQAAEVKRLMGRVAGDVDATTKADTSNATIEYNGERARFDFVRDGDQNRVRLTLADGTQKTISMSEAMDSNMDPNVKQLISTLSALGPNAPAVYSVYDSNQEIGQYAAAMDKAINLYAANGVDVRQVAEAAKKAGGSDLISMLSNVQLEMAQSLGAKIYEQKQADVKKADTEYKEIRQKATAAIGIGTTGATNTQALTAVNQALKEAREYVSSAQDSLRETTDLLEELEQMGAKDTEAYRHALQMAEEYARDIENTQKTINNLEASRKELQARQPVKRKKGTVSFEGGTVEGRTFKGVDQSKLTRQQKNVVAMVEAIADAVNIDYVFFDGDARGSQGAYVQGGTVYININAGMAAQKSLAAATLSHELTHYMQQYAPAEYEELKQFIISEILKKNTQQFEALVQKQLRLQPNLTYDQAVDELVANACQTMLLDSKAIAKLARENMTLAEKIADIIENISEKIKAAFEDVSIDSLQYSNAVKAIEDVFDRAQQLWDAGIEAATQNYNAAQITGNENAAGEGSVQYQAWGAKEGVPNERMDRIDGELYDSLMASGNNIIVSSHNDVAKLVRDVFANPNKKATAYFGVIGADVLNEIQGKATNVPKDMQGPLFKENKGYILAATYDSIRHLNEEGKLSQEEIAELLDRMADIIIDNDTVKFADYQHDKQFVPGLLFEKSFDDGTYGSYNLISSGRRRLGMQTMYIEGRDNTIKKKPSYTMPMDNPRPTSETKGSQASANNIAENASPVKQEISSAATSINASKLPALFTNKNAVFEEGGTNIDIGGGRFDNVTDYLAEQGVTNYVFDPYNRPEATNTATLRFLQDGNRADTATCANVLNVIREAPARENVILETAKAIKPDGKAYFIVYEGDGTGDGRVTKSGWQENRKTASYIPEIQEYFDTVTAKGKLIIAEDPKSDLPKAAWETTPGKATQFQRWDDSANEYVNENAIYIKDGHLENGETVDFISAILDGKKKGETRTHKSLARGWLGLAKNGQVLGRAKLGDPIVLRKGTQEYRDSLIEGTEYDITGDGTKYYYPILETEDMRNNPAPIIRNGNYAQFQQYDESPEDVGIYNLNDFQAAKDKDGNTLFQVYAFEHDEPEYREMLNRWGGMSEDEIDNLFQTVDAAVEVIKGNLEALDYAWEADIDDRGFSPVKPNSDKLYKVSQDFSTLCRKRILQGAIQNQLQAALDRALTRDEGIAIRDALMAIQQEGKQIEVACALCYVESARMRSPAQIQKFLDNREAVIKDFFAGKDRAATKQRVMQAEADERQKIYEELGLVRGKGADNTMYDPRDAKTASLKKLPGALADRIRAAKKQAKAGYQPSAEQQRMIDTAKQMSISDFTTPEGLENLAKHHRELFDAYTSFIRNATNSKGIENDTWWRAGDSSKIGDLLIDQMNRENGLRTQSWSDFQVKHLMDYIAATIELATRGAKQHAYTKVADYVDLMGDTGVMINMSLIPTREFNGSLTYDDVEGFVYKEAMRLRDKYHATAGTICIGVKNEQIRQLLASMKIDYVIPYHHSGMAAHTRAAMHIPLWDDYQDFQNEKQLSGDAARENANRFGATLLSEDDPKWHEGPKFSDWFDLKRARQIAEQEGKTGKYGVMSGGYAAMQDAARRYTQICAERGLAPKFSYGRGDFSGEANYWKLLIDRKMVDNITGDIIEQQKIKPVFDIDTIQRILDDELARYGTVKEDQNEATRRVTEAFLSGKIKGGMSSEAIAEAMQKPVDNISITNITQSAQMQTWDSEGNELSEEQQRYFADSKIRDEDGNLLVVYHGTEAEFTVFDRTKSRSTMDIQGNFFSPWEIDAGGYGRNVGAYYLNIKNPATAGLGYRALNRFKGQNDTGIKAREYLERLGYDGVNNDNEEYIAFYPEQIKRIDNRNPSDNPDVRFQVYDDTTDDTAAEAEAREVARERLQAENAALNDTIKALNRLTKRKDTTIAKLEKQLQLTKTPETRESDARKLAGKLLSEQSSKADKKEIAKELKAIGDYILQTPTAELNADTIKDMARQVAARIVNEAEEVVDYGEQMTVNPNEGYFGEAIEDLSNRIVADAIGGIMQPERATYADRQKARRQALQDQIKQLKAEGKLSDKEADVLRQTIYDLTMALDQADSRYRSLEESASYRMAQIRAEGRARAAEIKANERALANEKVKETAEYYRNMAARARADRIESAGVGKYRKQIEKKTRKLTEWLLKNSDKEHVPEALKAPLLEFLTSIDFSSKRLLSGGSETRADMKFGARLQRLQQILANQQSYIDGNGEMQEDLGGYVDVSPDMLEYLREMAQAVTNAMNNGEMYTINRMSAAQLKDLSNLLSSISTAIRNMNNFMANERYKTVREAASNDINELEKLGKASEGESRKLVKFLKWKDSTPYYAMKRMGQGARSIFDGLTKGWEKLAFHAREIIDFTESLYTDKEVNEWKKEIHDITLEDGSQIRMTTAQIMAFSQLLKRDQAMRHLEKGGMRIGNIEAKKGTITDVTHYHLSAEDVNTILGELTARQAEVADKLQKYMAEKGAEWGNEVSMKRFGYNFYTEGENYFPIQTDSNDRAMRDTDAQENSMFRLLNLSSSKSLNPKASNALVVNDIFDVFSDHMADQAKLNALGLPILDGIKWFNFKERINNEDGTYDTRTLQAALEQAFGTEAQRYFRTLMKDINGVTESGDRGTDLASKMMSNYKIASVGANLRVAMLQPTAYVRAQTIISPRNLIRAFAYKNAYAEAMKYSGTALWKSLGYYDTNISRNMRQQIQHNETVRDKIVETSMKLAEHGDRITWGRLWVACKLQAQQMHPELEGEPLMQATADLFRGVVYSSQVMDSTLTRSELMRSHSFWDKNLTAFMAEPTLSYNILLDAYSEYEKDVRANGKQNAWQRNSDKILKAIVTYESSAIVAAIAESFADAVRDDDDEKFLDKFLQALFGEKSFLDGNLFQDVVLTGKIPYAKNIWSLLQGYENSDMVFGGISNLIKVFEIWKETVDLATGTLDKATKTTYYGNMTAWGRVYKTLQSLSQISGFPVSGMMRDVFAIWNATAGNIVPYWKVKTYDSDHLSQKKKEAYKEFVSGTGISERAYADMLKKANTDGNSSTTQAELSEYLNSELTAGSMTKAQADAIWAAQGWKKTYDEYTGKAKTSTATPEPTAAATTAAPKTATTVKVTAPKKAGALADDEGPNFQVGSKIETYDQFKKSVSLYSDKKETAYSLWESNVRPLGVNLDTYTKLINSADANGNDSVTQDELGATLTAAINRKELSEQQASAIWYTLWNGARSKTYASWAAKNGVNRSMDLSREQSEDVDVETEELRQMEYEDYLAKNPNSNVSFDDWDEYISRGWEVPKQGKVYNLVPYRTKAQQDKFEAYLKSEGVQPYDTGYPNYIYPDINTWNGTLDEYKAVVESNKKFEKDSMGFEELPTFPVDELYAAWQEDPDAKGMTFTEYLNLPENKEWVQLMAHDLSETAGGNWTPLTGSGKRKYSKTRSKKATRR